MYVLTYICIRVRVYVCIYIYIYYMASVRRGRKGGRDRRQKPREELRGSLASDSCLPHLPLWAGAVPIPDSFCWNIVPLIRHFPGRLVYRSAWSLCSYRGVTSPCNRCFRPIFLTPLLSRCGSVSEFTYFFLSSCFFFSMSLSLSLLFPTSVDNRRRLSLDSYSYIYIAM